MVSDAGLQSAPGAVKESSWAGKQVFLKASTIDAGSNPVRSIRKIEAKTGV